MVFVILGTLIGAGFASGQEIYLFFYRFGSSGIAGLILSSALLSAIIYKVLKISHAEKLKNYRDLIEKIIPHTHSTTPERKYFNTKTIINNIINLFILICFFIMIAGFGAYLKEQFGIPNTLGSAILATACFFVLQKNIEGVIKVNKIIVPFLIVFLVLIGILSVSKLPYSNSTLGSNISSNESDSAATSTNTNGIESSVSSNEFDSSATLTSTNSKGWLINSVIYAGYNSILLIPVLISLASTKTSSNSRARVYTRSFVATSAVSGAIAALLGLIVIELLSIADPVAGNAEMPVAQALKNFSEPVQLAYALIILSSIFTTSISLGNSFLTNTMPANLKEHMHTSSFSKKSYAQRTFALCLVATLFSNIGFANLITYTYPIFGIFGTIQAFAIFGYRS